jgi:hypothetical protein
MDTSPGPQPRPWYKAVWDLVVEVWAGSVLFAIIFAPAVGLDLAVKWLKTSTGTSEFLLGLLTWTKYAIAVLDALLYVVFMVNMAWRFVNELRWRPTKHVELQTVLPGHGRNRLVRGAGVFPPARCGLPLLDITLHFFRGRSGQPEWPGRA